MKRIIPAHSATLWVAIRALVVFTLIVGIGYTLLITAIGQIIFPDQANGSRVAQGNGKIVGSSLIGQAFTDSEKRPLARYFQTRPSAAGEGYDATASGASNLGPENAELLQAIASRRAAIAAFNGVSTDEIPPDAVTASASGLDPHISLAYAEIQVRRVAQQRGLEQGLVRRMVAEHTTGPDLGFLGNRVVNVVKLNLALDQMED